MNGEHRWDRKLNIVTGGRDASAGDAHHLPYEPTPYAVLERLAESGLVTKRNLLVDYGCGKGRVSLFLSRQTGCRSVGIDFNPALLAEAERNRLRLAGKADVLFLEEKADGVFKAIRYLSPDVIVLDEIGLDEDTRYIADAKNAGAEVICSSHGNGPEALMKRANVKQLIERGAFETFIGISQKNGRRFYEITPKSEFV